MPAGARRDRRARDGARRRAIATAMRGALAEDLRRFQTGQLVGAHQYTAWQLIQRWLRRHAAVVAAAAIGIVALAARSALTASCGSGAHASRAIAEQKKARRRAGTGRRSRRRARRGARPPARRVRAIRRAACPTSPPPSRPAASAPGLAFVVARALDSMIASRRCSRSRTRRSTWSLLARRQRARDVRRRRHGTDLRRARPSARPRARSRRARALDARRPDRRAVAERRARRATRSGDRRRAAIARHADRARRGAAVARGHIAVARHARRADVVASTARPDACRTRTPRADQRPRVLARRHDASRAASDDLHATLAPQRCSAPIARCRDVRARCARLVVARRHAPRHRLVRVRHRGIGRATGAPIAKLAGHEDSVESVRFDPTGTRVLSGSRDNTAILWDVASGKRSRCSRSRITSSRPCARRMAHDRDAGRARRHQPVHARRRRRSRCSRPYRIAQRARVLADRKQLAIVGLDGDLRLWHTRHDTAARDARIGPAADMWRGAFSRDGRLAADHRRRRHRAASTTASPARSLHELAGHNGRVAAVDFSRDGTLVSAGEDGTFELGRPRTAGSYTSRARSGARARRAVFPPTATRIATTHGDGTIARVDRRRRADFSCTRPRRAARTAVEPRRYAAARHARSRGRRPVRRRRQAARHGCRAGRLRHRR